MEEIIKAIVLGIIQGLTEFLPISSTAHLRILPEFFGWDDIGAAYTAVIQLGTLAAILIYFRKDIELMIMAALNSIKNKEYNNFHFKLLVYVLIGTIPILILGYLFKDFIRNEFRSMILISAVMIIFSIIIYIAEKLSKKDKPIENLNLRSALLIGFFQSLALIPGISRSGSTITGGLFSNLNREAAAKYSFLLSIPAILVSGLYELYSEREALIHASGIIPLIVATIVSGIVGYLSIWFMLSYLKKHTMLLFIIYRVLFGILILILIYLNIIN